MSLGFMAQKQKLGRLSNLIVCALLITGSCLASALLPVELNLTDLSVEADHVAYLDDGETIVASQNVLVRYKRFRISDPPGHQPVPSRSVRRSALRCERE